MFVCQVRQGKHYRYEQVCQVNAIVPTTYSASFTSITLILCYSDTLNVLVLSSHVVWEWYFNLSVFCCQILVQAGIQADSVVIPGVDHFRIVEKLGLEDFQVTQVIKP